MPIRFHRLAAALALAAGSFLAQAGVPGQGTWESTLLARDLNGDSVADAFYDRTLDVTWMADAGALSLMSRADGWAGATSWAAQLDLHGVTGWRLPALSDTGAPGCDAEDAYGGGDCGYNVRPDTSELAHLFFVTLGNASIFDGSGTPVPDGGLGNTGPFSNVQSDAYWLGTPYQDGVGLSAWYFSTAVGVQGGSNRGNPLYAWAVRDGDVASPAPEPATWGLMLGGLAMVALGRRGRARR
jgi:hypothetical protein